MIYSKLLESNSPLELAARLSNFLHDFNCSKDAEAITFITQSETSRRVTSNFDASRNEWHGTITIVYEAGKPVEEKVR